MPTGVIVGTAVISHVTNDGTGPTAYHWHLTDVKRFKKPRAIGKGRQPQPVWFTVLTATVQNRWPNQTTPASACSGFGQ